jgi:hypothetical protein
MCLSPLGTPPDAPGVPALSVPDTSNVPDVSGVPDVSRLGGNPLFRVPDTPNVPDVPGVLDVSGIGDNPLSCVNAPGVPLPSATRPNDHLLFAASSGELLSTPASINPQGISRLLRNYPDKRFVDTLVSIASSGVRIGYEGDLDCRTETKNHRSTLKQVDVITKSIQIRAELKRSRPCRVTVISVSRTCAEND